MKISIICFDLSHNALGRAYLLGKVLSRRYQIEIQGFIFPQYGNKIWSPCNTGEFRYKNFKGRIFPIFFISIAQMIKHITGDVIYALKPRVPSYGVSLLAKILFRKPIVLDIDDLETSWNIHKSGLKKLKSFLDPISNLETEFIEKFICYADHITTVSTFLKERYGRGIVVPHGKDTKFFNPKNFDREELRKRFNIQNYKIIMFLGSPRPHKGLEDIFKAIDLLGRNDIRFMIIGKGAEPRYDLKLKQIGQDKLIFFDPISFHEVPKFLSMADLVVLPQKKTFESFGQIPAKVFDAMAMGKPIIATDVSDLPEILNGCGIIVEPDNIPLLAEKINWVLNNPQTSQEMGILAREKCIREYSWDVMDIRLKNVFDQYL